MKPKNQRLVFIVSSILVMGFAAALILSSLHDTMIFFYTPTQLAEKKHDPAFHPERALRIGGLVKKGSVINLQKGGIHFTVTDLTAQIPVTYHGLVPSLFRDGQGVVAQGHLDADGTLQADTILAKHDETYMPKQVVDALKASGRWKEGERYGKGNGQ